MAFAFTRRNALRVLTASAALALAACGGGSSNSSSASTATASTTTTTATTPTTSTTTAATSSTSSSASTSASTSSSSSTTASTTASTGECTPLVPKAGDSLTYANTASSAGTTSSFTTVYDYSSGSYSGKSAILLTQTSTVSGKTTTSLLYLDPVTGATWGNGGTQTTMTSYDPADYETRLRNAVTAVGQSATVNVKARISGADITSAFSPIGGGTALNVDYTFTIVRMPNETITAAGTSYNTCKLQLNATVNNMTLEGGNPSNPLYGLMFNSLSAMYAAPINVTTWVSSQIPSLVKATSSFTALGSTATSTTTLTAVKLAGR